MNWPLQDAKNRYSQVVKRAQSEGPQTVTLRAGCRRLSAQDYDRLTAGRESIADALLAGPDGDGDFVRDLAARHEAPLRDFEF